MRKLKTDMEKKLLDFEVRIQNCEKPERNPDMTSAIERVVDRKLPTVNAESDTEKELIEKKRYNLIYFNVPKCHDDDIETRLKQDFDCIKNMYGPNNVSKDHISNIFRIGKKGDKPRPLIVKFTEMSVKSEYCKMSFGESLTVKFRNEILKISVAHDQTQKQREEYKKLSIQLNKM